jgi:hypothetical protein
MASIYKEYEPSDAFVIKMQKMKLSDFAGTYYDEDDNDKTIRNNYDNRMRNKNLVMYYLDELLKKPRTRTIGTQTDMTVSNKTNKPRKVKPEE